MEPFWEKMGLSTEPQMWRASELLDCLRQHRQDGILIYFFYFAAVPILKAFCFPTC